MTQRDRDDVREMARRVLEQLQSEAGRPSATDANSRAAETAALFEKGREIDPATLHEPFTV